MSTSTNIPVLLTEIQTAEVLGLKPQTLRSWRLTGEGPRYRKIGAAVRYHPTDLEEYIQQASRQNTSDKGGL